MFELTVCQVAMLFFQCFCGMGPGACCTVDMYLKNIYIYMFFISYDILYSGYISISHFLGGPETFFLTKQQPSCFRKHHGNDSFQ